MSRFLLFAFVCVSMMLPVSRAQAQDQPVMPPEVIAEIGPVVVGELKDRELAKLARACPDSEPAKLLDCLQSNRRARRTLRKADKRARATLTRVFGRRAVRKLGDTLVVLPVDALEQLAETCSKDAVDKPADCLRTQLEAMAQQAGGQGEQPAEEAEAIDFPPEALELLPRPVLDALPKVLTKFLRADDYKALKQACPQTEVEDVIACLDTTDVSQLLDTLHSNAVIASILEYMDVELPGRLAPEDYELLVERCTKPGEAWAQCALDNGTDSDKCFDSEEALARCVVENDLISERYLGIVSDKKAIFGKDLYVEFAGLMAVLPIDAIKALREACPQTDQTEASACFQQNEAVDELIGVYFQLAQEIVAESANDLAEAGKPLTEEQAAEYTEKFAFLFLTMPSRTIIALAATCQKLHPELEKITDVTDFDKGLACMEQAAQTNPVANPAYISKDQLLSWLKIARTKVVDILTKKELDAQTRSFRLIIIILAVIAGLGFLAMLLMPVFLKKRFPDRMNLLWKASLIGAVTFALTVMLLGATLVAMRAVQARVATQSTSPKLTIAQGVFDVLEQDDYVEGFSELSKLRLDFIKGPLRDVVKADLTAESPEYAAFIAYVATHWSDLLEEPEIKPLARNVDMLQSHQRSFRSVIGLYKNVDWLMGIVPILLSFLAVILYLLPLKDVLIDIASAPARVARRQPGVPAGMAPPGNPIDSAMRTVWAEIKSLLPFLGVVLLLLPIVGLFLSLVVQPLIEILISYYFLALFYLLLTEASAFVLYATLISAMFLLIEVIAIYIVAMALFIGTVRKILRSKFHYRHTFGEYKRFWIFGGLSMLLVLVLPVIFVYGLGYITFEVFEPDIENLGAKDMLLMPMIGFFLYPIFFWAARGVKALGFIKSYPVALGLMPSNEPDMDAPTTPWPRQ